MSLWHYFFPQRAPSPATQESIARIKAVTQMMHSETDYYKELAEKEAQADRMRHG